MNIICGRTSMLQIQYRPMIHAVMIQYSKTLGCAIFSSIWVPEFLMSYRYESTDLKIASCCISLHSIAVWLSKSFPSSRLLIFILCNCMHNYGGLQLRPSPAYCFGVGWHLLTLIGLRVGCVTFSDISWMKVIKVFC